MKARTHGDASNEAKSLPCPPDAARAVRKSASRVPLSRSTVLSDRPIRIPLRIADSSTVRGVGDRETLLRSRLVRQWSVVMTDLRKPPLDQKYLQSMSTQKLVRDLLELAQNTVESAKVADESSQWSPSPRDLNIDSWPTGNRIRESF